MLRYFVIAAILVVGAIVIVTAYDQYRLRIVVRGGRGTMAPRAEATVRPVAHRERGLRGAAPWALSALPECMLQTQEWTGTLPTVRAHLPHGARQAAPGSALRYGDCTILVSRDQAVVRRGDDVLVVPPVSHLYTFATRAGGTREGVALVRTSCDRGRCTSVLRVYRAFAPQ